jgi:hypothetical protein
VKAGGDASPNGSKSKSGTRLALVGREDPAGTPSDKRHAGRARQPTDVTFFLRAMPSGEGWAWRLFARTGASGAPRPVYAAERVYPTQREAIDQGRNALASTWAASALSHARPNVARAG